MSLRLPIERFDVNDPVRNDVPHAYTPTVPLRLISDAAWELGVKPDAKLEIDPVYESAIAGAAGEAILRDLIGQTHLTHRSVSAPYFKARPGGLESCGLAELRMLMAIRHPYYFGPDAQALPIKQQSVRIVSDEAGEPLLIQKNADAQPYRGVNLGMTVRSLHVGETTWPAGTLMQVSSSHRIENNEPVTVIPPDKIRALGPLRLSAFALSIEERAEFVGEGYGAPIAEVIGTITMDEIRDRVSALQQTIAPAAV